MTLAGADALADRFGTARATLGEQVRASVKARLGLVERIDDRRDSIGFAFERDGVPFVSVIVSAASILLYFHRGAVLPDPAGLLAGGGRRGRYICVRQADMVDSTEVAALLEAALALGEKRA